MIGYSFLILKLQNNFVPKIIEMLKTAKKLFRKLFCKLKKVCSSKCRRGSLGVQAEVFHVLVRQLNFQISTPTNTFSLQSPLVLNTAEIQKAVEGIDIYATFFLTFVHRKWGQSGEQ